MSSSPSDIGPAVSVDRYTVHFLVIYAPIPPALQPRRVSPLHRRIEANEVANLWNGAREIHHLVYWEIHSGKGQRERRASPKRKKAADVCRDGCQVAALSTQMRRQHRQKNVAGVAGFTA